MVQQAVQAKAETLVGFFKFQEGIFQNALENLSEEAALKRASENSNHINWLLGHLLHCRYMLANMIGVESKNPFGEKYWKGIEDRKYPSVSEIVAQWPLISEQLIDKIESLSDEEIEARPATNKPSLAEMISFFAYHEAYHLGQIGIVRKITGLGAMKSF